MGNVASELQHIGNQLEGSGAEEKAFLASVFEDKQDEATKLLREHPMVIWAHTKDNLNAWHIAAQAGNVAMLEVLNKLGQGWTKMRKPLPGQPAPVNCKSKVGQTPLMLACEAGHANAMQYMLACGAGLLDADHYGNTALHWAAYRGQAKVLEILLANSEAEGAGDGKNRYVNLRNECGLAPLHFAAFAGALPAARVLVQYKSKLMGQTEADSMNLVTCSGGSTPLHLAAMKGDIAMATFLLEEFVKQSADPTRKSLPDPRTVADAYALTALRVAANLQRTAIMPLLDITRTRLDSFKLAESAPKSPPVALFRSTSNRNGQMVISKTLSSGASYEHTLPAAMTHPGSTTSAKGSGAWECPPEFVCPITSNVMEDPVVAGDGKTYERSAIEMWLELGSTEYPGGGEERINTRLVEPNVELKTRIQTWRTLANKDTTA